MENRNAPLFGVSINPTAGNWTRLNSIAQMLDRSEIDFITSQDHPYNSGFYDTWTLLTAIAARTTRLRVMPNVLSLPLRPPVMLAKSAASLDLITKGRVELGIGAGLSAEGAYSYGAPLHSKGQSVSALEEGLKVIKAFWQGARTSTPVTFNGSYYHMTDAEAGPAPQHHIGVWVGTYRPRSLRITGRLADGWLPSSPYLIPSRVPAAQAVISAAAEKAGRKPTEIRRGYNIPGLVIPLVSISRGHRFGVVVSSAREWVKILTYYYYELGLDTFIFWALRDEEKQIRRFVEDVVPAARQAMSH